MRVSGSGIAACAAERGSASAVHEEFMSLVGSPYLPDRRDQAHEILLGRSSNQSFGLRRPL